MQLNISTCYAMQIMLYLARSKKTVPSMVLSKSIQVSQRYTLQIAARLRDGGFITAHTGTNGGYILNKDASTVSAYDIITLMEGDLSIPDCEHPLPDCNRLCTHPSMYDTLNTMKEYVDTYLQTITFDKLAGMDVTGHLSEILNMVEAHIIEIKLAEKKQGR